MKESDDLLIKLCLEGDKDAFGLLVKKYQNAVYSLCYHIIGNFADAEDLAQDVFVKVYLDLAKIREPSRFAGWLYRIAINICKMWLRAKKAVSVIPLESIIQVQNEDDTSPDRLVEDEETNASIRKALEVLSEMDRTVVLLYYIVGLKCDEIAYSLSLSLPAVKNRLLKARRQLKKELIPMMESSLGRHEVDNSFTENVLQRVSNHAGAGFFQVDTKSGKIWWLKSEDEKGIYIGQPEGAVERKPGTYVPYENKSGAGLFILETTTGKVWWTNGEQYENPGKPETNSGEVGTYVPYDNDLGAGFRIVNTKTEDAWWTNGTDWGKVGKLGKDQLALSNAEREQKKDLLLRCDKLLNEKKHKEAIELLQELYDKYSSDWLYAEYALGGIGRCYWKLGQNDKAIECLEKAINDHSYLMGFSPTTYLFLGLAYADSGNKEKALESLEESVRLCQLENRDPESFTYKEAKRKVEELKTEKESNTL
jgi:RNA polymerase sigma-70 factor (ECF subfamily)